MYACETHLADNITTDSVLELLLLADYLKQKELRLKCLQFIGKNVSQMNRTSWKELHEKGSGDLVADVFESVGKYR